MEVQTQPYQRGPPKPLEMSEAEKQQVDGEVAELLRKEAVIEVEPTPGQFVSKLFTIPKKDGTRRPVANLHPLNKFLVKRHFKMESTAMLEDLLKEQD